MRPQTSPHPRFLLRPVEPRDFPALAHLLGNAATMGEFWPVMDAVEVRLWIAASCSLQQEYGLGEFAIIDRATRRLIGDVGVMPSQIDESAQRYNISWVVHHAYRRRGVATEAATIVAEHAFACGVISLEASMAIEHVASRRVAAKIGMQFQRIHRHPHDAAHQHTLYELHCIDWLTRANSTLPDPSDSGSS